jgi:hypothetical protein
MFDTDLQEHICTYNKLKLNASYHSVQTLLSSRLLPKNIIIKIYKTTYNFACVSVRV